VAGGSPWALSAIAVNGPNLLLTASTGDVESGPYPGGSGYYGEPISCGTNSTLLLASSADDGIAWNTSTISLDNATITSLQTEINGNLAAVAWTADSLQCGNSTASVGAVTSTTGGATWSEPQTLDPTGTFVPSGEQVEMAPDQGGLMVAFVTTPANRSTSALHLVQFDLSDPSGFTPMAVLPAPSSWTLQGADSTPAYLLTPTYLIPLRSAPYTALPFSQLQLDGGGIGELPQVVSLVPTGPHSLEIAATTPDNLGVDCWTIDVLHYSVTQTCHVALSAALTSTGSVLPIVALIDDGNGWVAIGASGSNGIGCGYPYPCPPPSGPPAPVSATDPSSGAAVGTSVCLTGCTSAQGLAAYSFTPASGQSQSEVAIAAAACVLLGAALYGAARFGARRPGRGGTRPPASSPSWWGRGPSLIGSYRLGLAVWVLLWAPLALLAFFPSYSDAASVAAALVLLGGLLGAAVAAVFHGEVRRRLQHSAGAGIDDLINAEPRRSEEVPFVLARQAAYYAYGSWVAAGGFLLALWVAVTGGFGPDGWGTPAVGSAATSPPLGGIVVATLLVVAVVCRMLYHRSLAVAASAALDQTPPAPGVLPGASLRTQLGAGLLVWNPLVGLILGAALQGAIPWSPISVAEAFLPITLLGIAVLAGAFGRTVWSFPPSPS
jgi:hypothetical protein